MLHHCHVEVDDRGQEGHDYTKQKESNVKHVSSQSAVVPEQLEMKERGEDKRQKARGKTANQSETEFKTWNPDGHAPRHENENSSETADHEVTHYPVANTLHVHVHVHVHVHACE